MLLCAALLYGSGAHWLAVQGGAWAGMIAARASRASLGAALTTTFDGLHPCRACRLIEKGAGAESAPRASRPAPTADFAYAEPASLPAPIVVASSPSFAPPSRTCERRLPLVPPPKASRVV